MKDWMSPVILEAMTLRGLGSYLHGGRLEVRPLTILCGTNGSGKSTWFRMLSLLKQSSEEKKLPFAFSDDICCGEGDFQDYTNAFVKWELDRHASLASPEKDAEYGRLGTIGLHVKVAYEVELGASRTGYEVAHDAGAVAQAFLWGGQCPPGMRLRIRMSDTTCDPDLAWMPRHAEIAIGDLFIRFEETPDRGRFEVTCCRAFWPGCEPGDRTELAVAHSVCVKTVNR